MKKLVMIGLAGVAVLAAILIAKKSQSPASPEEREQRKVEKRREMFEKIQAGMEELPEDFPPVVMFNNVAATRANSERMLELLEKDSEPVSSSK